MTTPIEMNTKKEQTAVERQEILEEPEPISRTSDGFQTAFRGEVIQPTDFGYERARKIWNASIDRPPGIIARCSGVADVVAAVNFARENELLIAVRGGGHNVSGKALCDDGIVIDLSGMKGGSC